MVLKDEGPQNNDSSNGSLFDYPLFPTPYHCLSLRIIEGQDDIDLIAFSVGTGIV